MSEGLLQQFVRTTDAPTPPTGFVNFYCKNNQYFYRKDNGDIVAIPLDAESIQDVVGGLLQGDSNVDVTYDDGDNTLTIALSSGILSVINNKLDPGDNVSALANDAGYQNSGQVSAAVTSGINAHEAAADPHPQYNNAGMTLEDSDEVDATQSKTSQSFSTRASVNHTAEAGETYIVFWFCEVNSTSTSGRIEIQIEYDGQIFALSSVEGEDSNDWVPFSGFKVWTPVSSGPEDLDLNWRRANGSGTASIRRARLALFKL